MQNIPQFNDLVARFTTQLQNAKNELKAATSDQTTAHKVSKIVSELAYDLAQIQREVTQLTTQFKGKAADLSKLTDQITVLEENFNVAIQDTELSAAKPALQKTLNEISKVKSLKLQQHMAATYTATQPSKLEANLLSIATQLEHPSLGSDVEGEVRHQLGLLSELKTLKQQIIEGIKQNPALQSYVDRADALIAKAKHKLDASDVSKALSIQVTNKKQLAEIRAKAQENALARVPAEQITREISQSLATFVATQYEAGIEHLGKPPCDYCLVVFGSLARQESGPYPDLDNMLVIEKKTPETLNYFVKLNQFVADRIYRLGEAEHLGKAGLRFCSGNINPQYLRYDFRYTENPRAAFVLDISETAETSPTADDKKIAELRGDLQKVVLARAKLKAQLEDHATPELEAEHKQLQAQEDQLIKDLIALSPSKKAKEINEKYEKLKKITDELDLKQKALTNPSAPDPALVKEIEQLQAEQNEMQDEIECCEAQAYGGLRELFVAPTPDELSLLPTAEIDKLKNKIQQQDVKFIRGVISDSLPILGNTALYQQYMQLRQAASPAMASTVNSTVTSMDAQQRAIQTIKDYVKDYLEEVPLFAPNPITANELPEIVHVKHELYRFPQIIVAKLAELCGVSQTNTFERVRALCAKGVFDPDFGERLMQAMDHLVKLRVLAQTSYGAESELVSTGDWNSFCALKTRAQDKLADMKRQQGDLENNKKACQDAIKQLKAAVDNGDKSQEAPLAAKEAELKRLERLPQDIEFLEDKFLKEILPELEKKEFKTIDPDHPQERIKNSVIPDAEISILREQTVPILHELFNRAANSVKGDFRIDAFKENTGIALEPDEKDYTFATYNLGTNVGDYANIAGYYGVNTNALTEAENVQLRVNIEKAAQSAQRCAAKALPHAAAVFALQEVGHANRAEIIELKAQGYQIIAPKGRHDTAIAIDAKKYDAITDLSFQPKGLGDVALVTAIDKQTKKKVAFASVHIAGFPLEEPNITSMKQVAQWGDKESQAIAALIKTKCADCETITVGGDLNTSREIYKERFEIWEKQGFEVYSPEESTNLTTHPVAAQHLFERKLDHVFIWQKPSLLGRIKAFLGIRDLKATTKGKFSPGFDPTASYSDHVPVYLTAKKTEAAFAQATSNKSWFARFLDFFSWRRKGTIIK